MDGRPFFSETTMPYYFGAAILGMEACNVKATSSVRKMMADTVRSIRNFSMRQA
jgi:hypothetical protein